MAWVEVHFSVSGEEQYARAFQSMAREADDLTEPLTEVGNSLLAAEHEQFRTEGAFGGDPWKPLNRDYEIWKRQHYGEQPILVRTGAMRNAAIDPRSLTISPHRLIYEIDSDYAIYHQAPTEHGHPPQRKIVNLPGTERRSWDRIFAEWLNGLSHRMMGM